VKLRKYAAVFLLALVAFQLLLPFAPMVSADTPTVREVLPGKTPEKEKFEFRGSSKPPTDIKQQAPPEKKETAWEQAWDFYNTTGYKYLKTVSSDLAAGGLAYIELAENGTSTKFDIAKNGYITLSAITRGFIGLFVDGKGWEQKALDFWDAADKGWIFSEFVEWSNVKTYLQTFRQPAGAFGQPIFPGQTLAGLAKPQAPLGQFGKFAGFVGIAFSSVELIGGLGDAFFGTPDYSEEQADAVLTAIAGVGGILMGLAIFASAPPVATLLVAIGLFVWVVGTFGKYFTDNPIVRNILTAPVVAIKNRFKRTVSAFGSAVKLFGKGVETLSRGVGRGIEAIGRGVGYISKGAGKAIQKVGEGIQAAGRAVGRGLKAIGDKIKGIFG
jgi:hypothetical protein